ncbi:hypothetical protein BGLA2_860027 [Burkholderia gladioli]|nr:hypothetical protein BGLA2_860027 [Burkholderia gladioli]
MPLARHLYCLSVVSSCQRIDRKESPGRFAVRGFHHFGRRHAHETTLATLTTRIKKPASVLTKRAKLKAAEASQLPDEG